MKARLACAAALIVVGCGTAQPDQGFVGRHASAPTSAVAGSATSASFADPPGSVPAFTDPMRRDKLLKLGPALDEIADDEARTQNLPGLALGVVADGELILRALRGVRSIESGQPVEIGTPFEIASVTKPFTATAILQLRDAGLLRLDDPVSAHLPELASIVYLQRDDAPLTIRQLLTHTSGLPSNGRFVYDAEAAPTVAQVLGSFSGLGLEASPGERYQYSNLGFTTLALVVQRISGMSFESYIATRVLEPHGMTSSGWPASLPSDRIATGYSLERGQPRAQRPRKRDGAAGSGGLYCSLDDLGRFVSAQLDAWPPRGDPESSSLRRSTRRESHQVHAHKGMRARRVDERTDVESRGVGLGWHVYEDCTFDRVVWHNGDTAGFSAAIYFVPSKGVGVIVLANLADADVDRVARRVLRRFAEAGAIPDRAERASPAFEAAVERAMALYETWDARAFGELFSPAFQSKIAGEDFRKYLEHRRTKHGGCKRAGVRVVAPAELVVRYTCERGELEVEAMGSAVGRIELTKLKLTSLDTPRADAAATVPPPKCR